jgi:hypothetical protein
MMHICSFFKKAFIAAKLAWVVAIFLSLNASMSWGQSIQNFGTTTGVHTSGASTAFIPNPTTGTTYARIGTGAGSINRVTASNPLGTTGAYVRAEAPTGTSVNKVSPIVNNTAGKVVYARAKLMFGDASAGSTATSGTWYMFIGNGAMYSDGNAFSGTQVFSGLRFAFGAAGAITMNNRAGTNWNTTGLSISSLASGIYYDFEIIGNNQASGNATYTYNGVSRSVAINTMDLYINGMLIGSGIAKGAMVNDADIRSITFYGESSTSNEANIFIDDVELQNTVPASIQRLTQPTPHNLSSSNYSFTSWDNTSSIGSYPSNMVFHWGTVNTIDPTLPNTATQDYVWGYNYTAQSRINGLGANGIEFINTSPGHSGTTSGNMGEAVVGINTTGRQNIQVSWTAARNTANGNRYLLRGQYRIGNTGAYTDLPGTTTQIEFNSTNAGPTNYGPITLPAACENQAEVQIRWVYYWSGSGSGARDGIRLDDISITSTASCTAPTTQASGISFSSVGTSSLNLNWTNGNGAGRVILAKAGSAVDANPTGGSNPTANLAFGSGTEFGTGNFTVFNGTGSGPITITGLNPSTTYHFRVYEYCSPDRLYNVSTATNNPNSTTTQCATPTTQASNIVFSSVSSNQFTLNWTNGNGAGRVILIKQGSAVDANPADGSNPTANLAFSSGTQIGTGNYTVFNGTGSGPITITGLNASTTYHVRVYEYCSPSRNYNTSTASNNPSSQTTTAAAVPTLSFSSSLSAFGPQCINGTYGPNTFTISGSDLTAANVTVSALSGYEFATAAGGPYSSSLSLTQPGGAYSQVIHVRFLPTAAISYVGNIVVGGGGASSINMAANGSGINGTVGITTTSASAITTSTASSGGTSLSTTCGTITAKGVVWGLTANPTVPSANSTNDGTGTANFTSSITGLSAGTIYNYRSYATNSNGVTNYGTNLTFTTLSLEPTAHAASFTVTSPTVSSLTLNFSAANTITNSNGYIILRRIGAAPTGLPLDATGYSVGNTIGDATVAAIITNTAATSSVISGLDGGTNYFFSLIPYGYNGSSSASYNYYTAATIPVADGTTLYNMAPQAGDIVFTAFQASFPDGYEFITLRRLDLRGMTITDNGILSDNTMRSGEGNFTFPNLPQYADVPAGTTFRLDEASGTDDSNSFEGVVHLYGSGTAVLGVSNFQIAAGGDQGIIYTGTPSAPSFIAGITGADAVANWNTGATSTNTSKAPGTSSDFYMGTPDNGYYSGTATGVANTIRTSAVTSANWTTDGSAQPSRFINKNILFNTSNYSSGSITFSGVTANSFTIDASGVNFVSENPGTTRYIIIIRNGANPSAPANRYTCYSGTLGDNSADFTNDPTVVLSATDVCTGTTGSGRVIYLGYDKPNALTVSGLTNSATYHVQIRAFNGNGWSAAYGTPRTDTQTTLTLIPEIVLSSPNQIIDNDVQPGTNNHILSHFQAATTIINATLNQVDFTTSGTYTATELSGNFTLWYGTTNTFASATAISTVAAGAPGTYSFTGFSQTLNVNTTRYFWITCNVDAAANFPRTIQVAANPVLTFALASHSGTISAGGIQTITPVIPTVSTSVISNISESAADGGGNVTNDGSAAVTARGVVWGTAANPVMPSVNSTTDGSGIGVFTSSIASLNPQTQYFVRAYATNVIGTAYGSNQSFYTFSNPPTAQAVDLIATPVSPNQIDLVWDAASFPASGATVKGYVLIRATSPALPTLSSSNGSAPTAGVGVIVNSAILDPATFASSTGLAGNTTYNYLLVPYCWDGSNVETYHYLTAGAATATASTLPSLCTPPTVQVSSPSVGSITTSTAQLSWTVGNGTRTIVIIKQGSPASTEPIDGVGYTASNTFGNGSVMGPNEFVCHISAGSSGTSFTIGGLASSTTYHYAIYTFNHTTSCYLTPGATGSFTTAFSPSIIETFEPASKASYTNGNTTGQLGLWNFNDALIGTGTNDKKNGARSARLIDNGVITMLFNKTGGLGTVNIQHARFGTDGNSSWRMEVSNDGGATFSAYQSPVVTTTSTTLTTATFVVNIPGDNIRIRIIKLSGGSNRLNIDDISLGNFTSPNTVTTGVIAGSPFCITNTSGISVNIPFTSVGVYNPSNVYTAQLSNASGSFGIPTDIGTLAGDMNSGTISGTIPANTPSGTQYRIRVIASAPTVTGTQNSSNLTVFLNTPDASGFFASISTPTALNLGWTNPSGCFDQILIVGSAGSAVTAIPTGDGSLYTANNVFGTGGSGANLPAGEFAVFNNASGTTVNISGLTTGTTYFFMLFIRKGTAWSDGIILSATPVAIAVGDFRSNGSGSYSSAAVWQTWNGTSWVAASSYPNSSGTAGSAGTVNVTIRNGHTIILDASRTNQAIRNLTVENGARIWTQDSTYNGNRYMTIYGDISCLGNIGRGANLYDNISFNIEGNPTTISGTGNFNASRLRKSFNANLTTNLIIAMNMGLKFASGVGSSSGTVIYNNNSTSGNKFNVTINENTIVTLRTSIGESGNISIDGIDGEGSNERGGKVTVNGTLIIPGTLFALTNNLTEPVEYEIGTSGLIRCVNICTANEANVNLVNGSRAGGCNFTIKNGGRLEMTGGIASNPNTYNKPFSKRNNTLSPYTFVAGFGPVNNNFNLEPGSIVEYSSNSGSMPIQTQNLTYSNLVVSGAAVKTINSTLNVLRDITILSPTVLNQSGFDINIGGDWNSYGSAGFTEGTANVNFNGAGLQKINCSSDEDFYNLTIQNASTDGVELNSNVNVANNLNLGTNGRLFFGATPRTLRLTKMDAASNSLNGSNTALIDMTGSAHNLIIGCENPAYSGIFNAGSNSTTIYNRTSATTLTDGNQEVMTNLSYANLSLSGTDNKITDDDFTVTRNLLVEGSSTQLLANTISKKLSLGGNLTLSNDAVMNINCFNNLSLETIQDNNQELNGNGKPLRFFNFNSAKADGLLSLTGPAGNTTLRIRNNFELDLTSTALFEDNQDSIFVSNDVLIGGASSANSNYNFSGLLIINGNHASTDIRVAGLNGVDECKAELNSVLISSGNNTAPLNRVDIMPSAGGEALTIKANLTIQSGTNGAVLATNNNNINIGGNWTSYNESGFEEGTSTVTFNGSALQVINTTGGEVFHQFTINNSGPGVAQNSNVQVANTLNLQNGLINLNNNRMVLGSIGNDGNLSGGSTNSHLVSGTTSSIFERFTTNEGAFIFPIGAGGYSPITITLEPGASGALSTNTSMESYVLPVPHPQIGTASDYLTRYWKVNPVNYSTTILPYSASFVYLDSDIIGTEANIWPVKYGLNFYNNPSWLAPAGSGGAYVVGTGGTNLATNTTNWNGLFTFSDFTGSGPGNPSPLPITLIHFDAVPLTHSVNLIWSTATEINNDFFTVERSTDGFVFTEIGRLKGAGNSNSRLDYQLPDEQPFEGVNYYRLKQTDYDGKFEYSRIIPVTFTNHSILSSYSVYQDYQAKEALLVFNLQQSSRMNLELMTLSGQLIFSEQFEAPQGINQKSIRMNELAQGIYLLRVFDGDNYFIHKIIR